MNADTITASPVSTVVDTSGRKGIAYDWRGVIAEVEANRLDSELAALPLGVPV